MGSGEWRVESEEWENEMGDIKWENNLVFLITWYSTLKDKRAHKSQVALELPFCFSDKSVNSYNFVFLSRAWRICEWRMIKSVKFWLKNRSQFDTTAAKIWKVQKYCQLLFCEKLEAIWIHFSATGPDRGFLDQTQTSRLTFHASGCSKTEKSYLRIVSS